MRSDRSHCVPPFFSKKSPLARGFSVKSVVHVKLEKEEVEGAGRFYFLERPEGDEVATDAYDFHGDDGDCS